MGCGETSAVGRGFGAPYRVPLGPLFSGPPRAVGVPADPPLRVPPKNTYLLAQLVRHASQVMNGDLETIVNLEFGKAVDRISAETQERLRSAMAGMPRGGQMEATRLKIQLDQAAQICHVYARIWLDLLEAKSGGHLTRENVDFIVRKVQEVVAARKSSLLNGPDPSRLASAAGEIAMRMDGVAASIRRDLEIRIRKQQAFPKKEVMTNSPHINVTIQNAANVNLGSQVGTINATLTAISDQSYAHYEVAAVLKELSEAVLQNPQIPEAQKQEALQVITDIAKQAEAKPEARSIGTLKAMIAGLPSVIGMAADFTTLWDKCAPVIRHFFGI